MCKECASRLKQLEIRNADSWLMSAEDAECEDARKTGDRHRKSGVEEFEWDQVRHGKG